MLAGIEVARNVPKCPKMSHLEKNHWGLHGADRNEARRRDNVPRCASASAIGLDRPPLRRSNHVQGQIDMVCGGREGGNPMAEFLLRRHSNGVERSNFSGRNESPRACLTASATTPTGRWRR